MAEISREIAEQRLDNGQQVVRCDVVRRSNGKCDYQVALESPTSGGTMFGTPVTGKGVEPEIVKDEVGKFADRHGVDHYYAMTDPEPSPSRDHKNKRR